MNLIKSEPYPETKTLGILNGIFKDDNWKIVIGKNGILTHIYCNGKEITNVSKLSLTITPYSTELTLTMSEFK